MAGVNLKDLEHQPIQSEVNNAAKLALEIINQNTDGGGNVVKANQKPHNGRSVIVNELIPTESKPSRSFTRE